MKNNINLRLNSDMVYQLNDDGMMVYIEEEGMVHALNTTAAEVILLIEKGIDKLHDILNIFQEQYNGVSREVLSEDIEDILIKMQELRIIEEN